MRYLLLGLLVFGVNLLPAFGPPTWSLLVYARLRWHFDPVLLVGIGALCAAGGRLVLGVGFRALRYRFSQRYRSNLLNLEQRLLRHRTKAVALLGLFVLSPLPSAQLFCAAGLLDLRLIPLTLAFFVGRLVTYSLYVTSAVFIQSQFGSILDNFWGTPWSIALQLVLVVGVVMLPLLSWRQHPKNSGR